ncbi:MAG TPA: hypothetical protein VFV99_05375 [Kofleriaceae bacterium]|nr:hypothetical protein [Kofleriaceae bacterium]
MFATDQPFAFAGDEVWLEGTFEDGALVNFAGASAPIPLNVRYEHRAAVTVPADATTGALSIQTSGGIDGKVPFRGLTFKPGLQPFMPHNDQNDYARLNYLDRVHVGGTAETIGNRLYLIGGKVDVVVTADVESAAIGLDGGMGRPKMFESLQTARAYHSSIRVGRYIYVIGGLGSGSLRSVERAQIGDDDSLGPFETVPGVELVEGRYGHKTTIIGNYVYAIGGRSVSELATVERAPIYENDELGTFEPISDVALKTPRSHFTIVKGATYLYAIGGLHNGIPITSVEKIEMFGNGYVSDFQEAGALREPRGNHGGIVVGNNIYVFGGAGLTGPLASVERAPFSEDGTLEFFGEFNHVLTEAKQDSATAVIGNYVYVIGGERGGNAPALLVERAGLFDYGALDTFANAPVSLNQPRSQAAVVVIGKWLYVIGGVNGTGALNTTEVAEIKPDGSLSDFGIVQAPGLGTARYGHRALINDNVLYILGGLDTAGNPLKTIEAAAINPDGSLANWGYHGTQMFTARGRFSLFTSGITVYGLGGYTSATQPTATATVEYASVNAGTQFGSFNDLSVTTLDDARDGAAMVAVGRYLYVIGGDASAGSQVARALTKPLGTGFTGPFTPAGDPLTTARSGHTVTRLGHSFYVIGGADTSVTVERAMVDDVESNVFGFSPSSTVQLMTNRSHHATVTLGNYVYLIGGKAEPANGSYLYSLERAAIR